MKLLPIFSLLAGLMILVSACQTEGDPAVARVSSAMSAYQAGNSSSFEQQLSPVKRQTSAQCPGGLQFGCLQLAYENFSAQSPVSFSFSLYPKQTTPEIKMVLVEGKWGGSPAVVSCQVFFVLADGSDWLIDNFDAPEAVTCQQRSDELTNNLFGPIIGPILDNP